MFLLKFGEEAWWTYVDFWPLKERLLVHLFEKEARAQDAANTLLCERTFELPSIQFIVYDSYKWENMSKKAYNLDSI